MDSCRIVITGVGVVSACGNRRARFFEALEQGRSGIAWSEEEGLWLGRIADLEARQVIDVRALRRMARVTQLATVAARDALDQARPDAPPARSGLLLGTGLGSVRETYDYMKAHIEGGVAAASPLLFPSTVMNAAAGQLAIELGFGGPNSTVNHREVSPLGALGMAADMLRLGRADVMLAGAVDDACSPVVHAYRRLCQLSPRAVRPYAQERDGMVVGEGAALFVLEREADARARGAAILGVLAACAFTGDDRARIGTGQQYDAAIAAVRQVLGEAALEPGDIDYVAGGGAGTDLDRLEACTLERAFDGMVRPHGSILGQIGEFMASPALRVAAGVYALEAQTLPGTVGYGTPDPAVPVPDLVTVSRAARVDAVLVPVLAQGGANAALVLTRS